MSPTVFRLVLLVSCAHALVHVFELALPSVEQMIGEQYGVGKETTGLLGTVWRVPFGVGALLAGWLVDRYGSKRLLMIYLAGCAATAVMAAMAGTLAVVFAAMFAMGCFASIYHPAGLALISRETTPETRGAALGWHGIFGSIGIASAPFLAGMVFSTGEVSWRQYYLLLTVPALTLMVLIGFRLHETHPPAARNSTAASSEVHREPQEGDWRRYFVLVCSGVMAGFIYAAFMHFLPRYLDAATDSGLSWFGTGSSGDGGTRNRLAALVLLFGVLGQSIAGRFAKPGRLEWQLPMIMFASAPLLLWMAYATGASRIVATCALALVHFMNQPVYNSLVAQYVPESRRSLGYGFSNMAAFAIGGLGPTFAGFAGSDSATYGGLAVVAVISGCIALTLLIDQPRPDRYLDQ